MTLMLLQAGPFQADYSQGALRYIRVGNQEVVRMIYFAIRDKNWNTLLGEVSAEKIKSNVDSFSVRFNCKVRENGFHFNWQVKITGSPDGSIEFVIQGQAANSFLTNRAGLCILHSTDKFAGKPCCIEHPDGYFSHKYFPEAISPHQPFLNIKAMEWPVGKTGRARLDFEGDIFETEDQRNWSDASFKTYCTPLELPFPRLLEKGTVIEQSVKLTIADAIITEQNEAETITISQNAAYSAFPKLGLQAAPDFSESDLQFIKNLKIDHLRKDIFLSSREWQNQLTQAFDQSRICEAKLELAVFSKVEGENVSLFLNVVKAHQDAIQSILLFDETTKLTNPDLSEKFIPIIREQMPDIALGGGTDAHFAELNRNRMDYQALDFVSFALTPLAHLTDDQTLIDNMQAQSDMVRNAREMAPGKRLHVSPITLNPRSNDPASSDTAAKTSRYDRRQNSLLTAGWTLGSIKYLSEDGADAVTYFETNGPGGIIDHGKIYPVGELFQYIFNWNPAEIQITSCDSPLKVSSLLLFKKDRKESCLLVSNHTAENQTVVLDLDADLKYTQIKFALNNDATNDLQGNILTLAPMGVVAL